MKQNKYFFVLVVLIMLLQPSCKKECSVQFYQNTQYGTFTDERDGNTYRTVTIGNQVWMAENLRYVKGQQASDPVTCTLYGQLYSPSQTEWVCPQGWHVPSQTEWEELINFLGGTDIAGGKLKEAGTSHWTPPNTGAINFSGFSALPAGGFDGNSGAFYRGTRALFWSTTQIDLSYIMINLYYDNKKATLKNGFDHINDLRYPIRCLKD